MPLKDYVTYTVRLTAVVEKDSVDLTDIDEFVQQFTTREGYLSRVNGIKKRYSHGLPSGWTRTDMRVKNTYETATYVAGETDTFQIDFPMFLSYTDAEKAADDMVAHSNITQADIVTVLIRRKQRRSDDDGDSDSDSDIDDGDGDTDAAHRAMRVFWIVVAVLAALAIISAIVYVSVVRTSF